MNTEKACGKQHENDLKPGQHPCFLASSDSARDKAGVPFLTPRFSHRTSFALFLLAAGMMAGTAYGQKATGGTITNYALGRAKYTAHIFTDPVTNQIPQMTANTAPSGTASADSVEGDYPWRQPWYAMDGEYIPWDFWSSGTTLPHYLRYQFTSARVINGYGFTYTDTDANCIPKDFKLRGSNNGTDWTDLDTRTGNTSAKVNYAFNNTTAYTYYELYISANGSGSRTRVGELFLYSLPTLTFKTGGAVEYLVVAGGGGGGGAQVGGGGGAGGLLAGSTNASAATYFIGVGMGGLGGTKDRLPHSGKDSIFLGDGVNIVATGGGSGASDGTSYGDRFALIGGSGGGGAADSAIAQTNGASGTTGQGNKGGNGTATSNPYYSGGGGGSGGAGGDAVAGVSYGLGGAGTMSALSGTNVTYAKGGDGSAYYAGSGANGAANTGDGGNAKGDGSGGATGGNGGSGIVIVRYLTPPKGTTVVIR